MYFLYPVLNMLVGDMAFLIGYSVVTIGKTIFSGLA